ncbi:DUF3892 domain-containing protein [Priestia koreensis]|uniref:DUF3892 domain-containing protein n=1 Tax=Priestia koreensis TaxID=284581 RepID=A0A0M0LJ79_9BACI|nr:DUF3892 domain-containing protein [Priestia koreensis]KOO50773.1 hypothetical protein AMD01_03280 [Priestia koreensis]
MAKEQFVAVRKNSDGDLDEFQTASGQILSYQDALQLVQAGNVENVSAFKGKDGGTYIRSNPDGDKSNNLDSLPTF